MKERITLLDLGGVVFQSIGKSNAQINWEVISMLNDKYGFALNIGEDKFPDFLTEYNEITKQHLSGDRFLEFVFDTLEINLELIDMVGAESKIIIVSDNYRENIEYISKRYDFESWSIKQIYSFDYQMEKSNPIFFKRVLEDLEMYDKGQMIFIDDSPAKIKSAAAHGIEGLLFSNNEQIKEVLKKHYN